MNVLSEKQESEKLNRLLQLQKEEMEQDYPNTNIIAEIQGDIDNLNGLM